MTNKHLERNKKKFQTKQNIRTVPRKMNFLYEKV